MRRLLGVIAALLLAAALAALFWQQQRFERLASENLALRQKLEEATQLSEENKRLADQLKSLEDRSQGERAELLRLRAQAVTARQTDAENTRLRTEQARLNEQLKRKAAAAAPTTSQSAPPEGEAPEETPERKALIQRMNLSRFWGIALLRFAQANNGRLPADLASAAPYFDNANAPSSVFANFGIDQYELVYHGSVEGLANTDHIILAREKTPAKVRDDLYSRTYLFVDGHSEILNAPTPDGFDAREKQLKHVPGP